MTKIVLKLNCGDFLFGRKPLVFREYFRPPVFAKYSPGF